MFWHFNAGKIENVGVTNSQLLQLLVELQLTEIHDNIVTYLPLNSFLVHNQFLPLKVFRDLSAPSDSIPVCIQGLSLSLIQFLSETIALISSSLVELVCNDGLGLRLVFGFPRATFILYCRWYCFRCLCSLLPILLSLVFCLNDRVTSHSQLLVGYSVHHMLNLSRREPLDLTLTIVDHDDVFDVFVNVKEQSHIRACLVNLIRVSATIR